MASVRASRPNRRHGAILALVLAGLFVASLLGLGLVERVLLEHRRRAAAFTRQQCFWLAESGVERAMRRVAKSPDYAGETWVIPAEVLGTSRGAAVAIQIVKASPSPTGRTIRVEARLGDDPARRTVVEREHCVNLPVTVHGLGTGSFFGPFRAEKCACPLPAQGDSPRERLHLPRPGASS